MKIKRSLFLICLAVAGLSLVVSFYLVRRIPLALAALFPLACMVMARRRSQSWLAHISLAGFFGLSTTGVILDISLMPMALASTAALAAWDLLLEMDTEFSSNDSYDRLHINSLGIACGLGLFGVGIGSWIQWRVSFGVMLTLVIITYLSLNMIMHQFLQDKEYHRHT